MCSSDLPDEAVKGMAREWALGPRLDEDESWALDQIVGFLASCGHPEGIQALVAGLRERPVRVRMTVVEGVADRGPFRAFRPGRGVPEPDGETRAAIDAAIDNLLVSALEDEEEQTGRSGSMGDQSYSDPRVCDIAAHHLATRWEGKVAFRLDGTEEARDAAILALKNLWRREHGDEPPR